jgi:dipeptidyl aminopeptidase/acylaminoacyl peptidase
MSHGMQPEDVYRLAGASDPDVSPDGSQIAYQRWWIDKDQNAYRGAIWVAAGDGSADRQLTQGERRDATPRWSPDGNWLAFTSNRGVHSTPAGAGKTPGGGEKPQPLQPDSPPAGGAEARRLTDGNEDVTQIAWSPDSTRIAFTRRVRDDSAAEEEDDRKRAPRRVTRLMYKRDSVGWLTGRRAHIFSVSVSDGAVTQLTDGDCEDGQPAWSPDGTTIAFSALRGERWDVEARNTIYVVPATGGDPVALTGTDSSASGPVYSPDGRHIAYYWAPEDGTDPHNGQVAVMGADGSGQRVLTAKLDRHCHPSSAPNRLLWEDGQIVFTVEDRGNRHLYAVPADGSAPPELLAGGEQVISETASRRAYIASTFTTFPELYVDGRRVSDITASLGDRQLAEAERFTAVSPDGTEVDAWLVRPAGFVPDGRYPFLLSIHGGPFTQYGTGFMDEFQMYAGAGYAVLFANPRGGSGREEAWGRAIRGPINGAGPGWGTVDYQDLMSVTDTALARFPFLDPERPGVLGGSYGGFMTSWIVSHTDRFRAAISERAFNNAVSAFGSSDIFWLFERQFGGPLWADSDAWRAMSPSAYAADIRTPLLIMHSEQDLRCDIEQGEHLFILLRLLGREVEMLRFPAESHELSRSGSPVHRVQRFEARLEWFGRYL